MPESASVDDPRSVPKPIQTLYNGVLYRSRLEARWAIFFDTLGLPFQYEPEAYELGNGLRLLPDFWLPKVYLRSGQSQGVHVEIKPNQAEIDAHEHEFFAFGVKVADLVVFAGRPQGHRDTSGRMVDENVGGYEGGYEFTEMPGFDTCMTWVRCPECQSVGILFSNYSGETCEVCGQIPARADDEALLVAARIAGAHRFDWGKR